MRGAEAVVSRKSLIGRRCVAKTRIRKTYREWELDLKLRSARTRGEARLLHRAKLAGVECPAVLEVSDFSITMEFVDGKRPAMTRQESTAAGRILAKLHERDIIHGDYTPANLILTKNGLCLIDFGLGFVSGDIEDKAIDVFTMLRALERRNAKEAFLRGYKSYARAGAVLQRVEGVEKRVRYAL